MVPIVMLWMATKFRCLRGWPMLLLAPVIANTTWSALIIGTVTTNFRACALQYALVLCVGAWVFRESLRDRCGLGARRAMPKIDASSELNAVPHAELAPAV